MITMGEGGVQDTSRVFFFHKRGKPKTIKLLTILNLSEIKKYCSDYSQDGLTVPKPEDHDGKTFAPFLLRQAVKIVPELHGLYAGFGKMPYDFYCPSLQADRQLIGRMCQTCGLYFSSKKNVLAHKVLHKEKIVRPAIIRPRRIITRRMAASEVLCVIKEGDGAEWLNADEVEDEEDKTKSSPERCPIIITIDKIHQNPWMSEME